MCGLLGLLVTQGDAADFAEPVAAALAPMRHRGPDEDGTWHDDRVVFGFNRLSIIDIAHSHQPLRWGPPDNPERYALTFNGEIYNYLELREELQRTFGAEFHTEGDAESIVVGYHYWGEDIVHRLRGMFAFAVWDTETESMFLARDPFGIKPLFVAEGAAGVAFSSEKKCLLDLAGPVGIGTDVDTHALQHYVDLQYVPEPETLSAGIRRLESGSCARLTIDGTWTERRYFEPTLTSTPVAKDSEQAIIDSITAVLEDSVAKHMRADVTVGSFLSGGIDSTAVAALAKRHNPNLITFTTGFEREGYSEVDVAAESAELLGVEHVVKIVSPEEFAEAVPRIMWYLDDPVADPALVPLYFVAQAARERVKVVLSGEGADELFGGYTIYKEPLSLAPFDKVPDPLRRGLGRIADRIPDGVRGKSLLHRGSLRLEDRYYGNARSFSDEQLRRVLPAARTDWGHREVTAPIYARSQGWDPVARMQHIDMFTWLRGDILVKADKMTMANSLELRVPFLDREVFTVASSLPTSLKISHGTSKYALRRALEPIIPAHVLHRRKLGFPVPLRHWLAGDELFGWAAQIIAESQAGEYIDLAATRRMLDEHRAGHADHSRRIWTVLCFLVWHGIFIEKRITPDIPEPHYPVEI